MAMYTKHDKRKGRKAIIRLLKQRKFTTSEIAYRCWCSETTVTNIAREIGIAPVPGKIGSEKKQYPTWDFRPMSATFAVISLCIKDDLNQSLEELANRLSEVKCEPVEVCYSMLKELQNQGKLYYYDGYYRKVRWGNEQNCVKGA